MSDIKVNGISKKFGDQTVLDNLTLTFESGKRTALMGPSGCGKTTLLRIIAGLEVPDTGEITGIEAGDFGMVFQEPRLFGTMTAELFAWTITVILLSFGIEKLIKLAVTLTDKKTNPAERKETEK